MIVKMTIYSQSDFFSRGSVFHASFQGEIVDSLTDSEISLGEKNREEEIRSAARNILDEIGYS